MFAPIENMKLMLVEKVSKWLRYYLLTELIVLSIANTLVFILYASAEPVDAKLALGCLFGALTFTLICGILVRVFGYVARMLSSIGLTVFF